MRRIAEHADEAWARLLALDDDGRGRSGPLALAFARTDPGADSFHHTHRILRSWNPCPDTMVQSRTLIGPLYRITAFAPMKSLSIRRRYDPPSVPAEAHGPKGYWKWVLCIAGCQVGGAFSRQALLPRSLVLDRIRHVVRMVLNWIGRNDGHISHFSQWHRLCPAILVGSAKRSSHLLTDDDGCAQHHPLPEEGRSVVLVLRHPRVGRLVRSVHACHVAQSAPL